MEAALSDNATKTVAKLQSAMEASKCTSKHQRHEQDAGSEGEHVRGFAKLEAADATDEQLCDGKVEQAPEDVDR